jgi:alkaline phosphatase D
VTAEPEQTADSDSPFTHGVASFDPTADSAILWARVRPGGPAAVRWSVAPVTDLAPSATGEVAVPPDSDGCVAVTVDGLLPATNYRYWFEAGGHRSPVGHTRTLPASGTGRFRVAVVCCADYSQGYFGVYRAVAQADVDLVLHVGDYIYESQGRGSVRTAEPDRTVSSLDDYRARFAQTRADADLRALHLRHPMVAIWDDHDIADNAWRHGAKAHDDEEHGPWEERLAAAAEAWWEYLPYRGRDPQRPLKLWRSFAVGDLAELVVLDTRIAGRDEHADHEGSPALDDPARTILGEEQAAWAHERIRDTTRPWCLVVSAVVVNRMELPVPVGATLADATPSGYAVVDGTAICTDEWDGYPADRDRLVEAVADRGAGTVLLSGDVHSAWAFEGPCSPDGTPVAVEFTAPCVTSTPMARQLPKGWRRLAAGLAERLPEARWFELERHGFLLLDVEADQVRADWFSIDIEDPAARPDPAASWLHALDTPGRLTSLEDGPLQPEAPEESVAVPIPDRPEGVDVPARHRRRRRVALVTAGVAAGAVAGRALRRLRRRCRDGGAPVGSW